MQSLTTEEVKTKISTETTSNAICGQCGFTQEKIENDLMIACSDCGQWFHASCVDSDEMTAFATEEYFCPKCTVRRGPSTFYQIHVTHRHNYFNLEETSLPTQVGSKKWIEDFCKTQHEIPPPLCEKLDVDKYQIHAIDSGNDLFAYFYGDREWKNIFLIKDPDGLEMTTPTKDFKIEDALNVMGPSTYVDTIDVYRQTSKNMRLDRFVAAWKNAKRERLYNILSMEFSKTHLRHYFKPPRFVRELSWASLYWPNITDNGNIEREDLPQDLNDSKKSEPVDIDGNFPPLPNMDELARPSLEDDSYKVNEEDYAKKPEVELFCLISMAGSYTDFHIDFGGSSVYYHIFRGKKVFYVSPPTKEALQIYHDWMKDNKDHESWLGDELLKKGLLNRVEVEEGNTLLIPAGWIHAVLTPVDSIVFGGNFLHRCNISMQLRVNDIEEETRVDEKFIFPHFRLCNWYAAKTVAMEIREINEDGEICPDYLYKGATDLLKKLNIWYHQEESELEKFAPPILRKLAKELDRQKKLRQQDDVTQNGYKKKRETKKIKGKKRKSQETDSFVRNDEIEQIVVDDKKPKLENLEPGSLKFVIRRDTMPEGEELVDKDATEPVKLVEKVAEKDLMRNIFSSPSTSGRQIKPTAIVRENYNLCTSQNLASIANVLDIAIKLQADEPKIDLDLIAKQEDKEFEVENRKKKNTAKSKHQKLQGVNRAISGSDARKKNSTSTNTPKSTTARKKLAKMLKMSK